MGSAALRPSVAVGRLLRSRRHELHMTLREVSEKMAARGEPFPTSTLVRVEQGKLDPGVRRLHLLMDLYEIPPHLVTDLVELDELAVDEPAEDDLEKLHEKGVELWKKGDASQALAYLFKIRQHVPQDDASKVLRQKATLAFAVLARDLGKLRLARQLVEDLLCEPPDPTLVARLLVTASTIWRGLGSTEIALALVERAETHVPSGDRRDGVWVQHQKAKLLLEAGEAENAERTIQQAARMYRKLGDTEGEARAALTRVAALGAQGRHAAAIAAAKKLIRMAEQHDHEFAETAARLELGRLLVLTGSLDAGLKELRAAHSRAVLLGNKHAEFHAHYELWKAYRALGDSDREKFELQSAAYFVQFIDHGSPEANEIRARIKQQERAGRKRPRKAPAR